MAEVIIAAWLGAALLGTADAGSADAQQPDAGSTEAQDECVADEDCDDGNPDTDDFCDAWGDVPKSCYHFEVYECMNDSDCDDGDPATKDRCYALDGGPPSCESYPIEEAPSASAGSGGCTVRPSGTDSTTLPWVLVALAFMTVVARRRRPPGRSRERVT